MEKKVVSTIYKLGEEELVINIYTNIRIMDKVKFINKTTASVLGENYNYILKDLLFDFYLVDMFTDYDSSEIYTSDDMISDIENLFETTNIVDVVKKNIGFDTVEELNDAVEDNIEYQSGVHRDSVSRELTKILRKVDKQVSNYNFDDISAIAKKIMEIDDFTPDKILETFATNDNIKKSVMDMYDKILKDKKEENVLLANQNILATC